MARFLGPPGWAGTRREFLDFMVQGKINRGRHRDHPAGRHSIQTNQCPPPPSPIFLQAGCPSWRPTNSVKALKACRTCSVEQSNFKYCYFTEVSQTHMTCQWCWSQQRWAAKWRDVTSRTNEVWQPLLGKDSFHGNDTRCVMERENSVIFLVRRTPLVIRNSIHDGTIQVRYSTVRQFGAWRIIDVLCDRQIDAACILRIRCSTRSKARWFNL